MLKKPLMEYNPIQHSAILAPCIGQNSMRPFSRQWMVQHFSLTTCKDYDNRVIQRARDAFARNASSILRPAAVMIALAERGGELHLLLTKRATHLKHHPGQICFPGGKVEPNDTDIVATAIREMKEEIGVGTIRNNVLGSMTSLPTVSGYLVTPVIAFINPDYESIIDANEVDSLFEVPLAQLMRRDAITKQPFQLWGNTYDIYATSYKDHLIWGVTAQIIHALIGQLSLS